MAFHNRPHVKSSRAAAIRLCNRLTRQLSFVRNQITDKQLTGDQLREGIRAALFVISEYRSAIEAENWAFFKRPTR